MKSIFSVLMAICLILSAAAAAEDTPFTLRNGIGFGMDLDEVIAAEADTRYEIDREVTLGPVTFTELEYENAEENGTPADLVYLFAGSELAAVRMEYETGNLSPDTLRADLTAEFGASSPLDPAALGNAVYALDDEGRPEADAEIWSAGDVMIVLELDGEDMDVAFLNMAASWSR